MVCAARGSTVIKFALVGSHGEPVYATCCSCCDPSNGLKSSSKFKTHTRIYIYICIRAVPFQIVSVRVGKDPCLESPFRFTPLTNRVPTIPPRSISIA